MAKKSLGPKPIMSPMPVQMVATYNEDGTVNVMNAAWGGILDSDMLVLSLDKSHKTVVNILREKAFTVGLPHAKDIADCDYLGVVSGNAKKDKFADTAFHAVPSEHVHAPVIEEFPITFECEVFKIFDEPELGFYLVGKIVNVLVEEDISSIDLALFYPLDNTYHRIGESLGPAFKMGVNKRLKK